MGPSSTSRGVTVLAVVCLREKSECLLPKSGSSVVGYH